MPGTTVKRTGWVTFASIVMFMVGALNLVWAIEDFPGPLGLKTSALAILAPNIPSGPSLIW